MGEPWFRGSHCLQLQTGDGAETGHGNRWLQRPSAVCESYSSSQENKNEDIETIRDKRGRRSQRLRECERGSRGWRNDRSTLHCSRLRRPEASLKNSERIDPALIPKLHRLRKLAFLSQQQGQSSSSGGSLRLGIRPPAWGGTRSQLEKCQGDDGARLFLD